MRRNLFWWLCHACLWLIIAGLDASYEVAVLDRIVDGEHAVLIVGDPPEREVVVPADELPAEVRDGGWLRVELEGDRLHSATVDETATEEARERIREKLEALRAQGRRDRGFEAP